MSYTGTKVRLFCEREKFCGFWRVFVREGCESERLGAGGEVERGRVNVSTGVSTWSFVVEKIIMSGHKNGIWLTHG